MALELIIIGAGPAGLAAAVSAARQLYRTVVFDSKVYRNALATHMHNVPGWDHQPPAAFRAKVREDIRARYNTIRFEDVAIERVKRLDDGTFEVADASGTVWTAPKVILATGVRDVLPDIPGFAELWTKSIFHCLYCHGYEERGASSAGVLALGPLAQAGMVSHLSRMALRLAEATRIYTHGNQELAAELTNNLTPEFPYIVEARKIASLGPSSQSPSALVVRLEDGTEFVEGFMNHAPQTEQAAPFAEQLGIELLPSGDIKVDAPFNSTSMPGVYAAGDNSTMIKSVVTAMYLGGMAMVGTTMAGVPLPK